MIIFPLDPWSRGVLILIAVVLGLIFTMMWKPEWWRKLLGKKKPNGVEHAKVDKKKLDKFVKDQDNK
jgi:hypothetical protein